MVFQKKKKNLLRPVDILIVLNLESGGIWPSAL